MRFAPSPQPRALLLLILVLALSGCASWPRRWSARPCCIDAKPAVHRQPVWWHLFDVTVLEALEWPFHLVRPIRRLAGVPVRALNLQEGRVGDSAFFTDRDPAARSPEEVRWGPSTPGDVPAPPFAVTKAKTEGKTAGFFVTDARGVRYLFKLDPADAPGLLSGAEVVTSKLIAALGYHVPSYEAAEIHPGDLRAAATANGSVSGLESLLEPRVRGGTVRVSASRILDGQILGPAKFKRFRDCAEIRALKLAYAWVNNIDAKDHNSLLVWDGHRTVGYLIDFGTSLGADAGIAGAKDPCAGWLNIVDLHEAALKLATLGLYRPPCDFGSPPVSPGVGRFTSRVDAEHWKPYAPNLAFQQMTDDDARWMARRMARLSNAQVEAAVSAGRYSRPEDAAYLTAALEARRAAIIREYLGSQTERPNGEEPHS